MRRDLALAAHAMFKSPSWPLIFCWTKTTDITKTPLQWHFITILVTVLKQEVWQSPGNETKTCLKRLVLASIELRSGFKRRTRLNSATNVIYCKVKDEQTNEITNKMICTAINSPSAQKKTLINVNPVVELKASDVFYISHLISAMVWYLDITFPDLNKRCVS